MKSKMIIVAMFLLAVSVLPATADMVITVNASNGNQTATQQFVIQGNGAMTTWALSAPVALVANGVQLGTLKSLDVQTDVDPFINLRFAVEAGDTDTIFDINSAVVSFSALVNPDAYASAGVTLTSDGGGATITGLFGGMNYQARYNGSAIYADLVDGYTVTGYQTVTASDRSPAFGFQTILDSVSSIESEFNFTLSALDQASGTSRFEVIPAPIIPEPVTLSMLAMGGLVVVLKRWKQKQN